MANPIHEEIVRQGAEAMREWREENPEQPLDLIDADLSGFDLHGCRLWKMDLRGANLKGANLEGCSFREVLLAKATFEGANLRGADFTAQPLDRVNLQYADLTGVNFAQANLRGANFEGAILTGVALDGMDLSNVNFSHAILKKADLSHSSLSGVRLSHADLTRAKVAGANCQGAHLDGADVSGADFFEANLGSAQMQGIKGAPRARHLHKVRLAQPGGGDAVYFETCKQGWADRWLDWEHMRIVGKLPLFAASYSVLILIPLFFYVLGIYNEKVVLLQEWSSQLGPAADSTVQALAALVRDRVHKWPIPQQSLLLLMSTVLLAIGSTLYAIFAPSRIKEFSRDQWVDQLGQSLLHYWPLSWRHRPLRLVCAACYAIGGAGVLWVIATKVWRVAGFIIENTDFPWHPL
ncbi:MAG TPA: pentapeptide repeat-containing protein [Acidobacteriota bacterium]|nr:pentapeptide repeat-containing protein [Acidobacteriota bacterium]